MLYTFRTFSQFPDLVFPFAVARPHETLRAELCRLPVGHMKKLLRDHRYKTRQLLKTKQKTNHNKNQVPGGWAALTEAILWASAAMFSLL
jgi:hypothetical protein